jgi:hypothetical protein
MNTATRAAAGAALAALAAGAAIPALTGAQDPGGREIVVREKLRALQFVHAKASTKGDRLAMGDRVVTRQALFNTSNKPIGTLFTDCSNLGPAAPVFKATLQCTVTYRFRDGQIVAAGQADLKPGERVPIIGGTGAYSLARGEVQTARPVKGYDSVDVLHLAG